MNHEMHTYCRLLTETQKLWRVFDFAYLTDACTVFIVFAVYYIQFYSVFVCGADY